MKKYFFLLFALLAMQAAQGQIVFGPYLTYSGTETNPAQMTIQIGVDENDQKNYYVVYWIEGETHSNALFSTTKIINTRSLEHSEILNNRRKILSVTLTSLQQGATYQYFVCENPTMFNNYTLTISSSITPAMIQATKPPVLLANAELSGTLTQNGSVVLTKDVKLSNKNFVVNTGLNFKIFTMPSFKAYHFSVPNNASQTVSCFLISDTQEWAYYYYANMVNHLKTDNTPAFILHGGDFGWKAEETITQISRFPDLFGNLPIQVTEGNHSMGYSYTAVAPPVTVAPTSTTQKYDQQMIWCDKLFHYKYPGLLSPVHRKDRPADTVDYYSHYYSFDYGPMHVSVLDYEGYDNYYGIKDTAYVTKQLKWFIDDLATSQKKWKVVLTHYSDVYGERGQNGQPNGKPSYIIPAFTYRNTAYARQEVDDLLRSVFWQYGVHIVIDGHHHANGLNPAQIIDFKYKDATSLTSKKYLLMRVPVDADNSEPVSIRKSFFVLHFDGDSFSYSQYDSLRVGIEHFDSYVRDSIQTIRQSTIK